MSDSPVREKSIGVEVAAAAMRAVCLDGSGTPCGSLSKSLTFKEPFASQLACFIHESKATFGGFERVGVAVPALVAADHRTISYSTHIAEFSGLDLASIVEAGHALKVRVENDANAAAFAEHARGAGGGAQNLFYATFGTGVGGAFIFNGEIWHGSGGFAGEFGYVPVGEEGTRLEDVASTANIIRRTRSRVHQDNTSSLGEINENELTVSHIVSAAREGDDFALLMLERTGGYIGIGVASVINLLNIEKIVIGGPILEAGELILDHIIATAKRLSFAPAFETTAIVQGDLGLDAAAIGAGLLAQNA